MRKRTGGHGELKEDSRKRRGDEATNRSYIEEVLWSREERAYKEEFGK